MTITTKTGDDGKSRFKGKIIDKDSDMLEAIGTLDELQAVLGIAKLKNIMISAPLTEVQKDLWGIMGELSCGERKMDYELRITNLETEIREMEDGLPRQTEFLVPGVNESEADLNWARTVCRRAERCLVKYSKSDQKLDKNILIYINRLSDYLFILGRTVS